MSELSRIGMGLRQARWLLQLTSLQLNYCGADQSSTYFREGSADNSPVRRSAT